MELWTTFLLGLVGSLHCAGMCGPLALALPATGNTRASFLAGRVAYNFGRIITYCALGAVFGLIGKTFDLAGLQRWVSLVAGVTILLVASSRFSFAVPAVKAVAWMKSGVANLLQRRTLSSLLALGVLNGLLPCGLVYVACAAAAATGSTLAAIESMFAFGLGTVPMMLGVAIAARPLKLALRFKLQRLIPASLVLVGLLLILRGLSLGIPYLSPFPVWSLSHSHTYPLSHLLPFSSEPSRLGCSIRYAFPQDSKRPWMGCSNHR
jgi:sulfite exporter TauE/SafE